MIKVKKTVLTHHKLNNIYNLVKDINSYKLFLPGCNNSYIIDSNINHQGYEEVIARIDIEKMLVSTYFVSKNIYIPNKRIDINLVEGPFSKLVGYWQFNIHDNMTQVDFYLEYKFNNFILSKLYSSIFDSVTQQILDAFIKRADDIY